MKPSWRARADDDTYGTYGLSAYCAYAAVEMKPREFQPNNWNRLLGILLVI